MQEYDSLLGIRAQYGIIKIIYVHSTLSTRLEFEAQLKNRNAESRSGFINEALQFETSGNARRY